MSSMRLAASFLALAVTAVLLAAPLASPPQAAGAATIIEFRSKICPYCYQQTEILSELEKKYPGQIMVQYYSIDTDEPMFRRYRVSLVPTLIILSPSGSQVFRREGLVPQDELVSTLKSLNFIRD
jgi:thiol-disulfide isomerase/thioredoxin